MINRKKASELYNEGWCPNFSTLLNLSNRITRMAKIGGYELCIRIDSQIVLDDVWKLLDSLEYDVELHNGYPDILSISWG